MAHMSDVAVCFASYYRVPFDADRLRTLFNLFDRDGSGTLDAEELLEILTRGSGGLSLADAKEIVDSFDENKVPALRHISTRCH